MKVLVLLAGLAVMFPVAGCEEEHEHHHHNEGYGGSYEGPAYPQSGGSYQGPAYPQGYGSGEYRGWPNYPDYRP